MKNIFLGNNPVKLKEQAVAGEFVLIDGEKYYQIKNFDAMQPIFISLASNSDLWMYIASTGGLSAGRKNPDQALFPYYTDDKITESADITGSKTILRVQMQDKCFLWEPFTELASAVYAIERTISKSVSGNKLIFSEKNSDLGLTFSYAWMSADEYGWVKRSTIENDTDAEIDVEVLDGLQNILPAGIDRLTQNTYSTLVDGYKKTELIEAAQLALFRMEAILVDRPEPSESLSVNTVWCCGLDNPLFLLSSTQLSAFRTGRELIPEHEAKGVRGAFLACENINLPAKSTKTWYFVAEVNQDAVRVNNLIHTITNTPDVAALLHESIHKGTLELLNIVGQVDGIQHTADENGVARHFSNTLFNAMRGGVYSNGYHIDSADFRRHITRFNRQLAAKQADFLAQLPSELSYTELELLIRQQNDANLYRLFLEYLPLTFSRRHGDPSRPWNLFNINVKDENGNKVLSYQGNWRDIFQNWEALSLSYPAYINGIIAKFVNATTADGYNPYRVTNEGIDWEVIEPDNPWSNIGYWGDHQIIYLLKLMEVSHKHYPESLLSWLNSPLFACANVPYRLKTYQEIVADPKNSIRFDAELHHRIEQKVPLYGADAKLVLNGGEEVVLVTFTEKLLATLLAKISNFIPEAGIWMNTLRPEWNDANNALVGQGASMVTLYYMRRFVLFLQEIFVEANAEELTVSKEMFGFLAEINAVLVKHANFLMKGFDQRERRSVADELGLAGNRYRQKVYSGFSGETEHVHKSDLIEFLSVALMYIDQSIDANKRPDGMYHAYNLVAFSEEKLSIRHLYEMLEGQVAVLSSGKLSATEALALLGALRRSALYRADQHSYILYPNKRLPDFLEKNVIPAEELQRIPLLVNLLELGDNSIIDVDRRGFYHFNASFNNVSFLHKALLKLREQSTLQVYDNDVFVIEQLYEKIFDHQSFTGRSGTFYKYEGLGCIYWHMVSKLLLAIGECIHQAEAKGEPIAIIDELKHHYAEVKKGIGAHKSPAEYGSFPFDPYSHTPMMAGVQQPGMTGQVKEDIISRFFELGVRIENGTISFHPQMLQSQDFISEANAAPYLTFTYCAVPFRYEISNDAGIEVHHSDDSVSKIEGYAMDHKLSHAIFNRDLTVKEVIVRFRKIH